jgi:catechol 2,3-dioxygenase-like lactoylglutathione lyase family enzyme
VVAASTSNHAHPTILRLTRAVFEKAFPYGDDILALPVTDLDAAATWYANHFGMVEVERVSEPRPTVIMERDGSRIGFSVNGGDSSQEGAAILVSDIHAARAELESAGVKIGNWRVDERDGKKLQVFFVAAPDGLCYYFHQPIERGTS